MRKVYDFATTTPLDEIRFILETKRLNKAAAERSFKGNYGHELGKILKSSKSEEQILGSNTFTHILSYTSAAWRCTVWREHDSCHEQFGKRGTKELQLPYR